MSNSPPPNAKWFLIPVEVLGPRMGENSEKVSQKTENRAKRAKNSRKQKNQKTENLETIISANYSIQRSIVPVANVCAWLETIVVDKRFESVYTNF